MPITVLLGALACGAALPLCIPVARFPTRASNQAKASILNSLFSLIRP